MDSVIETQRALHEERERCLDMVVKEFLAEKKNQRERVNSDQRSRENLDRFSAATTQLIDIYRDENPERAREIQHLGGPNEFAEFYQRLKVMKSFYSKNPNEEATPLTLEFDKKITFVADPDRVEKEVVTFTDEEGYGKFLDMHLLFEKYINLKDVKKIDYIRYLEQFDQFSDISKDTTKKTGAYREYLNDVIAYLTDFITRAKPIVNIPGVIKKADAEFEVKWAEDNVPGWSQAKKLGAMAPPAQALDVSEYDTVEQLVALGADRLKAALTAAGLKCGGTVQERAQRLFATKTKSEAELAKLKKPSKSAETLKEERRTQELAKLENQIYKFVDLLAEERSASRENVERKQARAVGDDEEVEEDLAEDVEEEPADDDVPYNPKNLPLGWDGKPIPYWLYKLHGLNINYTCEICGSAQYKGPRAFQRHFSEWRHSHGLRCLGIPNTGHFVNITKINEAVDLYNKICADNETTKWDPEQDEQYEDSKGNVLNRRTYLDLSKQGLL